MSLDERSQDDSDNHPDEASQDVFVADRTVSSSYNTNPSVNPQEIIEQDTAKLGRARKLLGLFTRGRDVNPRREPKVLVKQIGENPAHDVQSESGKSVFPFPHGSRFESLNEYVNFSPNGRKLILEYLAYARDILEDTGLGQKDDEFGTRKAYLNIACDAVAKAIDPNYPSQVFDREQYDPSKLDPESTAHKYRQAFYGMIQPLSGFQIGVGLKKLAPDKEFKRPEARGMALQETYRPNLEGIDMTEL